VLKGLCVCEVDDKTVGQMKINFMDERIRKTKTGKQFKIALNDKRSCKKKAGTLCRHDSKMECSRKRTRNTTEVAQRGARAELPGS